MDALYLITRIETIDHISNSRQRKIYNERRDPFSLPDTKFKRKYRFNKQTVRKITNLVKSDISVDRRGCGTSPELQVLVALRCWGRREFQDDAGDIHGLSQPTVCRICAKVARALAKHAKDYIKMPTSVEEEVEIAKQFKEIRNFPGIIGAIDGTHIKIKKTGGDQAQYYINRKGFYSMNVQPGKGHNSTVLCIECWQQIINFHKFYQSIVNCQSTLEYETPINDCAKWKTQDMEEAYRFPCNSDDLSCNEIKVSTLDEVDIKEEISLNSCELSEFNIFHINETNDMEIDNIAAEFKDADKEQNIVPKIYQCNLCEKSFENFRSLEEHNCEVYDDDDVDDNNDSNRDKPTTFNNYKIQMLEEEESTEQPISLKRNQTEMEHSNMPLNITVRKRKPKENDDFIAERKGELECTICKELLTSYTLLNTHFQIQHPDQECHVLCCNKKLNKRYKLVEHLQQFHNGTDIKTFACQLCRATFSQYGNLRRHIRKKHLAQNEQHKWHCKYCNIMFKTRCNLDQHKMLKHFNKEFQQGSNEQTNHVENTQTSNFIKLSGENKDLNVKKPQKIEKETIAKNEVELICNSITSTENIQVPSIDIIDIKDEISISSDESFTQQSEFLELSCSSDDISFSSYHSSNKKYDFKEISNVSDSYKQILEYDILIAKWKKDLECPICQIPIGNFSLLSNHFQMEHADKECYIQCCQTILTDRLQIVEHIKNHGNNKSPFYCDICNKSFKNSRGLKSHNLQVHIENRSTYHSHLCYCKKSNQQENPLNSNVYDTTVCCQRKQKILEDDATIAKWKATLKCSLCTSTFSFYSLLRVHYYYAHPGERCVLECCDRKFSKLLDALTHIRLHLDPSAFKCEICDVNFGGKSRLMSHMRSAHDTMLQQKYSCDECDETFEHRIILTRHKNKFHTENV